MFISDFLSFDSDITIIKDSSSRIWLHEYTSADASTWLRKTYYNENSTGGHKAIDTSHKYLICYQKYPSSDIAVSEIPALSLTFFIVQDNNKLVNKVEAETFATDEDTAFIQKQISTGNVPTLNFSFEQGTIKESTGAEQSSTYYVRTDDYVTFNGDLSITKKADWLLWIYSWNLDGTGFGRKRGGRLYADSYRIPEILPESVVCRGDSGRDRGSHLYCRRHERK
jgi:hypothetical protein